MVRAASALCVVVGCVLLFGEVFSGLGGEVRGARRSSAVVRAGHGRGLHGVAVMLVWLVLVMACILGSIVYYSPVLWFEAV
jgi:hypothetical protein